VSSSTFVGGTVHI